MYKVIRRNATLPLHMDSSNCIHQAAPMCTPIQYMVIWTHPTQNPKLYLDLYSYFCTVHSKVSILHKRADIFPLKITPSHGRIWTPSNT